MRLLLSLLIVLGVAGAHAASFDCKAASATQERFICNNAELSRLDEAMAEAYRKHVTQLSDPARAAVRESQRSWLAYWPRSCSASVSKVELGAPQVSCAVDSYRTRLGALQLRPPAEGLVAYRVSESRFAPPKERDGQPSRNQISYPQLEATPGKPSPVWLPSLNTWLARDRGKWRSGLDDQSDGSLSVELRRLTAETAYAVERTEFYGHGAAHPMSWLSHHHFLLAQRREIQASDVFRDESWKPLIGQRVLADLKRQLRDDLQVAGLKELIGIIEKPSSWDFAPGKIEFHFNPYEVGPYAVGFVTVAIPAAALQPHLTPLGIRLISPTATTR